MPPESSVFQHISFATLPSELKKTVRSLFIDDFHKGKKDASDEPKPFDINELSNHREVISTHLNLYLEKLNHTDPVSFIYFNGVEKEAKSEALLLTFYLLSAQLYLEEAEHTREKHALRISQIKQCATLLYQLNLAGHRETPETILSFALEHSEKYLKYLGLTQIAPFLTEKTLEFSNGKTSFIKAGMDISNERRMYWVWGGGLLESILYLIPQDYHYQQQAQTVISSPDSPLGYVSWILYYTRFGIQLGLLLKHAIKGPWMSEDECELPWTERFKTQWHARKFNMLNDAIWATVNLVTFFWLNGLGMLGYWGNVLTTFLLMFDLSLNIWRFSEENTKNNATLKGFIDEIDALKSQIELERKNLSKLQNNASTSKEKKDKEKEINLLFERQKSLEKTRREFELDLKFKQYNLIKDVTYAASLVLAFSVVSCVFLPPTIMTPLSTMILGAAGAGACFILTVAYTAVSGSLDIMQARSKQNERLKDCDALIQRFKQCENEDQKWWMYLHMRHMLADSETAEKQIVFQKAKLVYSVMIDALFPALVFSSFMFLPLGYGLGALAFGFAVMALSNKLLNSFKPVNEAQALEHNQEDFKKEEGSSSKAGLDKAYALFVKNPTIDTLKQQLNKVEKTSGFFQRPGKDAPASDKRPKDGPEQSSCEGALRPSSRP